jgi:hypothetical protein
MGRSRRRWENNVKMGLHKVECGSTDWIELAQYRDMWRALVNAVMILQGSIECGEFIDYLQTG